jgi:hypothetical protein
MDGNERSRRQEQNRSSRLVPKNSKEQPQASANGKIKSDTKLVTAVAFANCQLPAANCCLF